MYRNIHKRKTSQVSQLLQCITYNYLWKIRLKTAILSTYSRGTQSYIYSVVTLNKPSYKKMCVYKMFVMDRGQKASIHVHGACSVLEKTNVVRATAMWIYPTISHFKNSYIHLKVNSDLPARFFVHNKYNMFEVKPDKSTVVIISQYQYLEMGRGHKEGLWEMSLDMLTGTVHLSLIATVVTHVCSKSTATVQQSMSNNSTVNHVSNSTVSHVCSNSTAIHFQQQYSHHVNNSTAIHVSSNNTVIHVSNSSQPCLQQQYSHPC